MASVDRDLDIAIFGASGFVGRLVSRYVAEQAPSGLRVGVAGRSIARLEAVRARLPDNARRWQVIAVDAHDDDAVHRLAQRTQVVVTTVGPYARHGLPLVAACADAGTDYVDITGEVLFMRRSAELAHGRAQATGARIVHACGFDSVPSDLSVLLAAERARADDAGELSSMTLVLDRARGGLGGGTVDSLRNQLDELRVDPSLQRLLADPYALSPDRTAEPDLGPQPDAIRPHRDTELDAWVGPFVMAATNTRVVRRSNALLGWRFGRRLRYREVVRCGRGPLAPLAAAGLAAALPLTVAALSVPPTRALLDRVLPDPGEGPAERSRDNGYFQFRSLARTVDGVRYVGTFAARGDPGFAATATMLGQSALSLVLDRDRLPDLAGVLTPATGVGEPLIARLRDAGLRITIDRGST